MTESLNNYYQDQFISHSVDLLRVEAKTRQKILVMLNQAAEEVEFQLYGSGIDEARTSGMKQARLNNMLAETNDTIKSAYRDITERMSDELIDMGDYVTKKAVKILNQGIGVNIFTTSMTKKDLEVLVRKSLIQGAPQKAWWDKQSSDLQHRFSTQIRMGVLQGETTDQLVQRIRGTFTGRWVRVTLPDGSTKKVREFSGGIMGISTREAEALVRTSVQTISNEVLHETYQENDDVIKGEMAVATLDGRTTLLCISRDGASWDLDGNPLEDSPIKIKFPGPPPWHFNCRTVLMPLTKSWDELIADAGNKKNISKKLGNIKQSTRASMDGQVPAQMKYEEWLKKKPDDFQKEVLHGEERWKMWKSGKLTVKDMIDQQGNPLSLEVLRQKLEES